MSPVLSVNYVSGTTAGVLPGHMGDTFYLAHR